MEIKNLDKAAKRIKKAIENKEKIILYGDADLDGVASVIILEDSIMNLGGQITAVYFPAREIEGYGVNLTALGFLKGLSPALLITLDCGISNFKEIRQAKKMGFEIVIFDHHEVLDQLPEAQIVVDPKQKDDNYPFKGLATAGIIFRFSQVLLKERLTDALERNFLELVALATIADMMPEIEENKILIEEGLPHLKNTWRPGLLSFFEFEEVKELTPIRAVAQKIIATLNVVEPTDHLNHTYSLLTTKSTKEAKIMIKGLFVKREQRQIEIKEITAEVESRISKKIQEPIIFEGDSAWPLALLGSTASRICRQYQKPTFLFKIKEAESRGAVRTPAGINGVEMMKKCAEYLLTFGGHPPAAGFTIKNENLEKFKECLLRNYEKEYESTKK